MVHAASREGLDARGIDPGSSNIPSSPSLEVIRRFFPPRVVRLRLRPRVRRRHRRRHRRPFRWHDLHLPLRLRGFRRLIREEIFQIRDGEIRELLHDAVRVLHLVPRLPPEEQHRLRPFLVARLRDGRVVPEHDRPLGRSLHEIARSLERLWIREPVPDVVRGDDVRPLPVVRVLEIPQDANLGQDAAQVVVPVRVRDGSHRDAGIREKI
mmetsp:Transcript_5499/g.19868  ORF Transcript_5499/g.19868 Transcript_5499/m.19868 type:complete len:210 (+) Transcript_5499:1390-2019(+)